MQIRGVENAERKLDHKKLLAPVLIPFVGRAKCGRGPTCHMPLCNARAAFWQNLKSWMLICECVLHNTRQFRRIHASGLHGGGLLPLQNVDIPSAENFQSNACPLINCAAFHQSLQILRTGYFGRIRDAKGNHFSALNRASACGTVPSKEQNGNHFRRQKSSRLSIIVEIA